MRRSLIVVLCLTATLAPSVASARKTPPRVWVSDKTPLAVRGTGFAAHERVVVTVTMKTRYSRSLRATKTGAFSVSWTSLSGAKVCGPIVIRAVGSRGSVASFKVAGAECAPGPVPVAG